MGSYLPPHPSPTILLEEPPEIEFNEGIVYFTDRLGDQTIRRAMRRSVAIKTFALFAERLRVDRLGTTAEIIQFPAEDEARTG